MVIENNEDATSFTTHNVVVVVLFAAGAIMGMVVGNKSVASLATVFALAAAITALAVAALSATVAAPGRSVSSRVIVAASIASLVARVLWVQKTPMFGMPLP